jgi:sporulation protein YlmC with PRC-barrel domain
VDSSGEYTYLIVKPANGEQKTLVLGPSWHVMGNEVVPLRGSKFSGDVVTIPGSSDLVVVTSKMDGKEVRYRTAQGAAVWTSKDSNQPNPRYILASDLKGKKVDFTDKTAGKVDDLVIELNSGRIAFLSIDPNKNVLGIGDTNRLVPFTVAYVRPDDRVTIDATKDMIVASTAMPKDIHQLDQADMLRGAYGAFHTNEPSFAARSWGRDNGAMGHNNQGVWAREGSIAKAIRGAHTQELEGKVVSMSKGRETIGNTDATLLTLAVDGQNKTVILPPSVATELSTVKPGDELVVEVWNVNASGGPAMVAKRISQNGRDVASWEGSPD